MTDNLKKFIEQVRENKELAAQLRELNGIEDRNDAVCKTIELAKQYGTELTAADLEEPESSKLSDSELESVSAAGGCGCAIAGGGGGDGLACGCAINGVGYTGDDPDCACVGGGAGWN